MAEIVAIRTDTINVPEPHEHVIAVKLSDGTVLQQGEVIERMQGGEDFTAPSVAEGPVHVHACHICGAYPYLILPNQKRQMEPAS